MKKLIILFVAFVAAVGLTACGGDEPINPEPTPVEKDTTAVVPGNEYVVYQANEKIFARTEAFKAIDARLDEIKALGVNVLWLMPIHPVGVEKTANSPYCVRDFKGVNPKFGTIEDLKTLVEHAHQKDMRVILDWIANHSAWDNQWYKDHPDWYGTATGDETAWKDVVPFNFNNKDMRAAMIDAMTYWVKNADIDGFRCDFAQGCPDDFWKEAIDAIRAEKKDAIMLAETSRTELYTAGFDWLYSWGYLSQIQNLIDKGSVTGLYAASDKELESTPKGKARLRYVTNHDACSEHSNKECYKSQEGLLAASCLTYFLGGVPLIYSSQEIGYMNSINFCTTSEKSVLMDWTTNKSTLDAYKQLMAVYHATAKLRGVEPAKTSVDNVALLTYKSSAGTLLVVVNTRGEEKEIATPNAFVYKQMKELISDQTIDLKREIKLPAYGYAVYQL